MEIFLKQHGEVPWTPLERSSSMNPACQTLLKASAIFRDRMSVFTLSSKSSCQSLKMRRKFAMDRAGLNPNCLSEKRCFSFRCLQKGRATYVPQRARRWIYSYWTLTWIFSCGPDPQASPSILRATCISSGKTSTRKEDPRAPWSTACGTVD